MNLRSIRIYSAAALCLLPLFADAQGIRRASQPAISPDGKMVAFSWQGDLWLVPRVGGRAERLTIHPATDTGPQWAPDSKTIVFASNRYGNFDVFAIDSSGESLRQLTFQSSNEAPTCVSSDGRHVYGHTSGFSGGRLDLFRVPIRGGDMTRLTDHPLESEYLMNLAPDGRTVYYNRGAYGINSWQKPGVKGTAMPDIWLADATVPLSNHRPLARTDDAEIFPKAAAGALTYVSNKGGWPNIWRSKLDGSGARQLTQHRDGTVRFPSVSADGQWVVYDFESDLYVLDANSGQTRRLVIDVPRDQRANPVSDLSITSVNATAGTGVSAFSVAPDGKRIVLEIRGDLFVIPERGGTTRRLTINPALDTQPVFIDAKTILYATAGSDRRSLKTVTIDGVTKDFLSDSQDLQHPLLSPDGKTLALHRGSEEVAIVPVGGGAFKSVIRGAFFDAITGSAMFSWSPDSKWLAVAKPTDRGGVNIVLCNVETGEQVIAARAARDVSQPRFLPNGKGIYFLANEFEDTDLFVVDLIPGEVTFSEDDLDKIDAPTPKRPDPKVEVVSAGIEHRMRRLTTTGATGLPLASADSRTIWVNVSGALVAVPVAGGAARPVADVTGTGSNLALGPGGQKLYYTNAGKLYSRDVERGGAALVPFAATYSVNLREEEEALFAEIWWTLDRMYYDTAFHGKDWAALRRKFSGVLPFVADRADFYALMAEMMEELDSSHLGATAPASPPTGSAATGEIGVDFDPVELDARGVHIVKRILAGSPASNPNSLLMVGDRIVSVDGVELGGSHPWGKAMDRKAGRKVMLKVSRAGQMLDVAIKPEAPTVRSTLEYQNWVDWQRQETERLSNGRLTYLHIRNMDEPNFQLFLRQIRTLTPGKKGAIIDVRYNGGGSTAHKVLGVLVKTTWLIRTTRGPEGLKVSENIFRGDSLELPSAMMFNSYSFSNAEIIGEGFRQLKRGPLIGERTPGYVIGTSGHALWDGGVIRLPVIGSYTINGENLENNGRRPDFNVPFDPNVWTQGRDLQLEKAVEELLKIVGK